MAGLPDTSFTSDHEIRDDGTVAFLCSRDSEAWPWLALPARHPIVLLTVLYWASVDCSRALGYRQEGKWSALTWTKWDCDPAPCGPLDHGIYENTSTDDEMSFRLAFFDAKDVCIVRFSGRGVVFRTRNFEGWRKNSKPQPRVKLPIDDFAFAPDTALALGAGERAFLAPLDSAGAPPARGLITTENGMPPGHPFLSGSGDHVNATHLAEVGRQFVSLLRAGDPFEVVGGEMQFDRYVELGVPFEVERCGGSGDTRLSVIQSGRACASMTIRVRGA